MALAYRGRLLLVVLSILGLVRCSSSGGPADSDAGVKDQTVGAGEGDLAQLADQAALQPEAAGPRCGDGVLDPGERCDTAITDGQAGACPTSCSDGQVCTADTLLAAGTCDASCSFSPVTVCKGGDGCCPSGCTTATDGDCSASCGDGVLDPGEKCDTKIAAGKPGACPKSCDDAKPCTTDTLLAAGTCSASCTNPPITACKGGDGCCPSGCTQVTDGDCGPACGDGVLDPGEKCDTKIAAGKPGACPTSCDDKDPCTSDAVSGTGCAAVCAFTTVPGCKAGESCQVPIPLSLSAEGAATVKGDSSGFTNDATSASCASAGPEIVYSFTTTSVSNLSVGVAGTGGFNPVVYLRSGSCAAGGELACQTGSLGATAIFARDLPPETYYLFVDSAAGGGAFTLEVRLSQPATAQDTCAKPRPLVFSSGAAGGLALDTADTAAGSSQAASSGCGGTGKELVYSFTINTPLDLSVSLAASAPLNPVIYLRRECSGAELACGAGSGPGTSAGFGLGSLPVGTYHLIVDGKSSSAGVFQLFARLDAPVSQDGESCLTAKPLVFSSGDHGTATDSSFSAAHSDNGDGACLSPSGADVVYVFSTLQPRDFSATLSGSANLRPFLYLRRQCDSGPDLACSYASSGGQSVSISKTALPPGVYYLWADAYPGTYGTWTLSATLQ